MVTLIILSLFIAIGCGNKLSKYAVYKIYDINWSVKDNKITVIEEYLGIKLSYSCELKDNILTLYNVDKSLPLALQLVYERK